MDLGTILIFLSGFMFGAAGTVIFVAVRTRPDGRLRIDRSDPDGPYLFLELTNAIDVVCKKRHVLFDVLDKNYTRK